MGLCFFSKLTQPFIYGSAFRMVKQFAMTFFLNYGCQSNLDASHIKELNPVNICMDMKSMTSKNEWQMQTATTATGI